MTLVLPVRRPTKRAAPPDPLEYLPAVVLIAPTLGAACAAAPDQVRAVDTIMLRAAIDSMWRGVEGAMVNARDSLGAWRIAHLVVMRDSVRALPSRPR